MTFSLAIGSEQLTEFHIAQRAHRTQRFRGVLPDDVVYIHACFLCWGLGKSLSFG
jgi:hypothetical protein